MTRQEYLSELSSNLMSLSAEEREDAVRFYEEYFEDAGPENEAAVMDELGKPYTLAKSIICEQSAYSKSQSYAKLKASRSMGTAGASAADNSANAEPDVMPGKDATPHTQYTAYNYSYENSGSAQTNETKQQSEKDTASKNYDTSYETYKENYRSSASSSGQTYTSKPSSNDNTAIFILGLIFGVFFGIPLLIFLIFTFIGIGLGALALAVCAVIFIILGLVGLASGSGLILICVGVAAAGLGFILSVPAVLGIGKFIPWIFRQIGKFFKKFSGGVA